jgi:hypothetical protein
MPNRSVGRSTGRCERIPAIEPERTVVAEHAPDISKHVNERRDVFGERRLKSDLIVCSNRAAFPALGFERFGSSVFLLPITRTISVSLIESGVEIRLSFDVIAFGIASAPCRGAVIAESEVRRRGHTTVNRAIRNRRKSIANIADENTRGHRFGFLPPSRLFARARSSAAQRSSCVGVASIAPNETISDAFLRACFAVVSRSAAASRSCSGSLTSSG